MEGNTLRKLVRRISWALMAGIIIVTPLPAHSATAGENLGLCDFADDAAAQAAWEPMGETAPVRLGTAFGRRALRLGCNFAATKIERASWDKAISLDLASSRSLEFDVACANPTPVLYFSIYFQSGEGWYHATFYPESSSGWNTVTIRKSDATIEGRPAGWAKIRTIRISAWRGEDKETEFYLSNFRRTGVLGADASVAVVRADSAARGSSRERFSVEQYAESMMQQFDALGVGCAVVSDLDLNAERLRHARLVVLPYNPSMSEQAAKALAAYLETDGKLLAFYTLPEALWPALKLKRGEHLRERRPGYSSAIRFPAGGLPGRRPS